MNRVPDRKKLRREYVRKKATGYLMSRISVALPVVAVVAIVMAAVYEERHVIGMTAEVSIVACSLIVGLFALKISGQAEIASNIPYVPPVTPSTLPTEEILVRSAEQPATLTETLLRAAQSNDETTSDQLLRVAGGATGGQDR